MPTSPRSKPRTVLPLAAGILALIAPAIAQESAPAKEAAPSKLVAPDLFKVPEGFEVTVWASTPMLRNPTNIDFDQDGRLWVAEGVNYRRHAKRQKGGDRIVVLSDTNGDGKADQSHVFVQEEALISPLGVAVFDNQVVVSQPPDLLVFTDSNRDGKFDPATDKREVRLTGFGGQNHDHSLHAVTAGPDGLWYWNQGNTGAQFTDKSGKTFRMGSPYKMGEIAGQKSDDGRVWIGGFSARMNPDGSAVTILGHNYRNSYEQIVSSLGDLFQSDNDDPPACRVTAVLEGGNAGFASADGKRTWSADRRPGQDVPTAEWRQEDPGVMPAGDIYGGGAPTGVAFYENGALDKKWRGLLLACDAGRNVVFGYLPKPDGAGFKLERFDFLTSNPEGQFAGSDFVGGKRPANNEAKTLFRPSDVTVGPDGAIYVADWYDPRVGGHADVDDSLSGTIYRVAPKGFNSTVPKLNLATTEGQVAALKSPAVNVRHLGFTRLKAQGAAAVPAVTKLLEDENPFLAARAAWLLAQMGPAGVAKVTPLLQSKNDTMRLVACRALRRAGQDVPAMTARMATDPSAAIRREAALTARDLPLEQAKPILLEVAKRFDGKDRAYLEAFGLGCSGREREIYQALEKTMGGPAEKWSDAFAWVAWRLGAPEAIPALKARALSPKLSEAQRKLMVDALAFIKTTEASQAMLELATAADGPQKAGVLWWLNNRKENDWKPFGLADLMIQRGLAKKEEPLTPVVSPDPPAGPSKLPSATEVLALEGDPKAGAAAVAACYSCHRIGQQGTDFGPDLTAFGKTQTREVIVNALLNPSADISHGYEGSRVITNDGLIIDGIVVADADPLRIKSMGGLTQSVPRSRIKNVNKLNRSLMLAPEALGLTGQTIADIAAYLQSKDLK